MGQDDLPRFPTPGESFGEPINQRQPRRAPSAQSQSYPGEEYFGGGAGIPPLPRHRYSGGASSQQVPGGGGPPGRNNAYDYDMPYPTQGQPMYTNGSVYNGGPPIPPGVSGYNNGYPPPPPPPSQGGPYSAPQPGTGSHHHATYHRSPRSANVKISTPESNLRSLFNDVDRNKNGYLTESELASALVNGDYTRFNRETVKLMIRMFDRNGDGAIHFDEFGQLWRYLHEWRNIFDKFDRDRSGSISLQEFHTALTAFGYNLSAKCIEYVFSVYAKTDRRGVPVMSFDMFVQSCIHLKSVTESFKKYDTDRDGYVTLAFEQFLVEVSRLR